MQTEYLFIANTAAARTNQMQYQVFSSTTIIFSRTEKLLLYLANAQGKAHSYASRMGKKYF